MFLLGDSRRAYRGPRRARRSAPPRCAGTGPPSCSRPQAPRARAGRCAGTTVHAAGGTLVPGCASARASGAVRGWPIHRAAPRSFSKWLHAAGVVDAIAGHPVSVLVLVAEVDAAADGAGVPGRRLAPGRFLPRSRRAHDERLDRALALRCRLPVTRPGVAAFRVPEILSVDGGLAKHGIATTLVADVTGARTGVATGIRARRRDHVRRAVPPPLPLRPRDDRAPLCARVLVLRPVAPVERLRPAARLIGAPRRQPESDHAAWSRRPVLDFA